MEFLKYKHLERVGTLKVEGLMDGICYIFPKIDGTNGSVYWDTQLKAGSRNRELTLENDNAGFYKAMQGNSNINDYFKEYPNSRLYGEWLVPHTLKTYKDNAWRNFYVFDVMDGDKYLSYEEYKHQLQKYGIEFIVPMAVIQRPTEEQIQELLDKNKFLIKDGSGAGEGIVVKRYDFINNYGETEWGKIITSEFKDKMEKSSCPQTLITSGVEERICKKYITLALLEKEVAKLELDNNGWSSKLIPRLLNKVFYNIIDEEMLNILKDFKNPTIDFRQLNKEVNREVKLKTPELFR
jgi:hypothetical protein